MGYIECSNCKNTFYTSSDSSHLCEFCGGEKNDKRKIGFIAYVWNKQLLKKQLEDNPDNAPQHLKRLVEQKRKLAEESKIVAEIKMKLALEDKLSDEKPILTEIVSSFSPVSVNKFKKMKKRGRHIDFFEKNIKNSATGKKGEEIVLKLEISELIELNRNDLAQKVMHISVNDDSAGFDIVSYDENGKEKLIEVKSTVLPKREEFSFYISENEKRIAEESTNYFIYLVFDVNNIPEVVKLKNPFSLGILQLQPSQYKVKGTISKP